jgi:uncharacterized LabA/DUF88 family protein
MFYSARNLYNSRLNFPLLLEKVVDGRQLIRAIAYIVQTPDVDQTSFIEMLTRTGFEIQSKALKVRPDGSTKGDWDMGLAIDAISLSDRVDVVILVSGDGDFAALVNMLKSRGVRVEVMSFVGSTAEELISVASSFYPIEKDMLIKEKR